MRDVISLAVPFEIFIDMENVRPTTDELVLFCNIQNVRFHFLVNKNSMPKYQYLKIVLELPININWYKLEQSGKDSLDIMLGCIVGITCNAYGNDPCMIYIISNDNGYDETCRQLRKAGVSIRRCNSLGQVSTYLVTKYPGVMEMVIPYIEQLTAGYMLEKTSSVSSGYVPLDLIVGVNNKREMVILHCIRKNKQNKDFFVGIRVPICSKEASQNFWKGRQAIKGDDQIGQLNGLVMNKHHEITIDLDALFIKLNKGQYAGLKRSIGMDEIDWAASLQNVLSQSGHILGKQKFAYIIDAKYAKKLTR